MRRLLVALSVLALTLPGIAPSAEATTDPRVVKAGWTRVASGLNGPVSLISPPGDARLFVVERIGRIRIVKNGVLRATPFLDIRGRVNTDGEGGLLSLAFRPDYRTSGLFFVSYVDSTHTLRIVRYHANPTADVASAVGTLVHSIAHPGSTNHYGGQIAFGPGGYLFISTGDGGGTGDPGGNAQNLRSPLGKVLRISVTTYAPGHQFSIPGDNPFAKSSTARHDIWHYGLRNPWRFSFDRGSTTMWIGDVGQGAREEVDQVWRAGGLNFGWDCREGTINTASTYGGSYCTSTGYTYPVFQYGHDAGNCAIIGGYTYRGTRYSALAGGGYVFGDYCSGNLWLLNYVDGRRITASLGTFNGHILGFGRDTPGELYLLSEAGDVYRLSFAHR